MRFGFWLDTSNDFEHFRSACLAAEAAGWHSVWVPDHFMPPPEGYTDKTYPDEDPELGPVHEAWALLAALAAVVPRVRLGTMVAGNTYRHPAVLAKTAATIDLVSGGRVVLGLGAGWQENEHRRYGIHYGTAGERLDRLEEACIIIKGLISNQRTDFAGRHYRLEGAPLAPKPAGPMPLMIGGGGERRTIPIAARYADEWNVWASPEVMASKLSVLDRACEAEGRDPAEVERSVALLVGFTDQSVAESRRADLLEDAHPLVTGTSEQVAETLRRYVDLGVDEVIIPDFNWSSESVADILAQMAEEVMPHLR